MDMNECVDRLYIKRTQGDEDIIEIEQIIRMEEYILNKYLVLEKYNLLNLTRKEIAKRNLPSRLVLKSVLIKVR